MTPSDPDYAKADSAQTLRAGLEEYYRRNPGLLDPAAMDPRAATLFRQHDAAHVVFGCDTSLRGETRIDTWTILGSTIGLRGYLEYLKIPQVNEIFAETGYLRIAFESLLCVPDILRILWRSRRLSSKWAWRDWEAHLDEPLADIRREFNIRVV
jgi:hypothetical protein